MDLWLVAFGWLILLTALTAFLFLSGSGVVGLVQHMAHGRGDDDPGLVASSIVKIAAAALLAATPFVAGAWAEGRSGWVDEDGNGMLDPFENGGYDWFDINGADWFRATVYTALFVMVVTAVILAGMERRRLRADPA